MARIPTVVVAKFNSLPRLTVAYQAIPPGLSTAASIPAMQIVNFFPTVIALKISLKVRIGDGWCVNSWKVV